ncbi:unnamed protein product, partial [Polarella glacialis]
RGRMQKITSITEQLKSRECKAVFNVLHAVTRPQGTSDVAPKSRQTVFNTLRRWKQIDISITESFNEAKDNVKYLSTLEKFIEPLYSGIPSQIIDTLPALMNSVKMIHTIARYYNTSERMTNLFAKVTNQMITNCKACILQEDDSGMLWDKSPPELIKNLEICLKLNAAYQEQYRITKDKLLTLPKGKQFDFSETLIFGRFDLFCRRVVKLIDMRSPWEGFGGSAARRLPQGGGCRRQLGSSGPVLRGGCRPLGGSAPVSGKGGCREQGEEREGWVGCGTGGQGEGRRPLRSSAPVSSGGGAVGGSVAGRLSEGRGVVGGSAARCLFQRGGVSAARRLGAW